MARNHETNERLRDASREKIKSSALAEFSQKGLFATRIQDIASGAGISQGLLYRHYASKDEIYIDLIDDALDKISEAALQVSRLEVSAEEKIKMSLTELFKTMATSEEFNQTCRLIHQAMNSNVLSKEAQHLLNRKRDIPYQAFTQIMKQGQSEGTLVEGDPKALSVLFWSTVNGLAFYRATRPDPCPLPSSDHVAAMFIRSKTSLTKEKML